ncbi:LOW QUALITY PROTEIN: hypothetical protein OSB04_025108 [Centaurea solstitialis]|uniref:Uncharacterized protein n=1 Tax=Centaurea solstitialis TaxID=347529 RepID=A0AA38T0U5_9ASTR|nr:LOW QUALITY PROTEIN: hypothetical protein OSB04_025108 [Centaurea solstitialis]
MKIWSDEKNGFLHIVQNKYVEKFFQFDQTKILSTSFATHFKFDRSTIPMIDEVKEYMRKVSYLSRGDAAQGGRPFLAV